MRCDVAKQQCIVHEIERQAGFPIGPWREDQQGHGDDVDADGRRDNDETFLGERIVSGFFHHLNIRAGQSSGCNFAVVEDGALASAFSNDANAYALPGALNCPLR